VVAGPNGGVFIDRDGEAFEHVLNFLRSPGVGVLDMEGVSSSMVRRVKREFNYFNIGMLVEREVMYVAGGLCEEDIDRPVQDSVSTVAVFGAPSSPGPGWDTITFPCDSVAALARGQQWARGRNWWDTGLGLCAFGEGTLYAVGGKRPTPCENPPNVKYSAIPPHRGIVCQREVQHNPCSGDVYRYDVCAGTWSVLAAMSTPRAYHGVCALNGLLYAVGGQHTHPHWWWDRSGGELASGERYDPSSDTWSAIAPLPHTRAQFPGFAMCALGEFIFVVGSIDASVVAYCLQYQPSEDQWIEAPDLHHARHSLCLCAVDGLLYAVGGKNQNSTISSRVDCYNPKTRTWLMVASLNVARYSAACCMWRGRLHVFGGYATYPPTLFYRVDTPLTTVESYDTSTNRWTIEPALELASPRRSFGLCTLRVKVNMFDQLLLER
jgi:hypothetical protein